MSGAAAAYAHCAALVRAQNRDRWLTTLFAPEPSRQRLLALYAFDLTVSNIRALVSQPMPGEIRLQWWIDVLQGEARGDVAANPVAAALLDTLDALRLPRGPLIAKIEAHRFDLYDDPMPTLSDLEGYCGETASSIFRYAGLILNDGRDPGGADAAGYAGVARVIADVLGRVPHPGALPFVPEDVLRRQAANRAELTTSGGGAAAIGHLREVAKERLAAALAGMKGVAAPARAAFLPLAVTRLQLGSVPAKAATSLSAWRRQWAIWRMAKHAT